MTCSGSALGARRKSVQSVWLIISFHGSDIGVDQRGISMVGLQLQRQGGWGVAEQSLPGVQGPAVCLGLELIAALRRIQKVCASSQAYGVVPPLPCLQAALGPASTQHQVQVLCRP